MTLNGEPVWFPRVHPGVPELVSVAEAEQTAERLRHQLLATLVPSPGGPGQPKRQPNESLVVEMRSAAETTVISAVVGLEAFCSHHVAHCMDQATGSVMYRGEYLTAAAVRDRSLDERYKLILPEMLAKPTPTGEDWWPVFRRVQGLAALTRHAISEPVRRSGLHGEKALAERFYSGEFVGAAQMLFKCFEYFSPNWVPMQLRPRGD